MTIKRYAGDRFSGLSTDTKPGNVLSGAHFVETDSGLHFVYDGSDWEPAPYVDEDDLEDYQEISEKGEPNGYASLDGSGKVPESELPAIAIAEIHVVADIAARDALTPDQGDVAIVEDASDDEDVDSGAASYIFGGTTWKKLRIPDSPVLSVNGETGAVSLDTDDIDEGSSNLYYTEARVSANSDVAANTAARHTQDTDTKLADGTANEITAATLRTHVDNDAIHRQINDSGSGPTDLWSAEKIITEIESVEVDGEPAGDDKQIQWNDDGEFGASADLSFDDANDLFHLRGYHRIKETAASVPSVAHDEAAYYVTTEEVGPDNITRVKARLGNGEDVIIASYIQPS